MLGLLLELQVVKKQLNIYKEPDSKYFIKTPELSAPLIDCVLYQYPDMSGARTDKQSSLPTEAQSPKYSNIFK